MTNIAALFLSVCMHTDLPCEEVTVEHKMYWSWNTLADATVYTDGTQHININVWTKDWVEYKLKRIMIQEVALLSTWDKNPGKRIRNHGPTHQAECRRIARAMDFNSFFCIERNFARY